MKSKLAIFLFLGLFLLGGSLLLRSWNGKPAVPVKPEGSREPGEPSAPTQAFPTNEPGPPQPVVTLPGTALFLPNTTPGTLISTAVTDRFASATVTPANRLTQELVPTDGVIGNTSTPAGRSAPDDQVFPLEFTQIRLYPVDGGYFAGSANMKNAGDKYLNNLSLQWRIEDKNGSILDQGTLAWPNLAPGETATIQFTGTQPYNDLWEKVVFVLLQ